MKRTMTIKTTLATLAAVVGLALGATTLVSSAQASTVQLHPPCDCGS